MITRDKILEELDRIPEDRIPEVYNFIHQLLSGLQFKRKDAAKILSLAGSWKTMPESDFSEFLEEIKQRRKNAFSSRRRS
jgi:hypothetical protein